MKTRLNRVVALSLLLISAGPIVSEAKGALVSRNVLKSFFQSGDKPTQEQFGNLIDSFIHLTDDGLTLYGIGATSSSGTLSALRLGGNVGINETLPDVTHDFWRPVAQTVEDSVAPMCTQFCGTSGFLPLQYRDTAGASHYGFLQIDMGADPGVSPGGEIFVTQWVWETLANTTVTTFAVPEPASAAVLVMAVSLSLIGRRRTWR